jgi:hypothetical protein
MFNRLFISPTRAAIWAGVAVAFTLAVILLFDVAPQRNQTGSVAVTRIIKEPMVEVVEVTPVFDAEAEKEALESLTQAYSDAFEIQNVQVHKDIEDDDFKLFGGNFNWQGVLTAEDTSHEPGAVGTEISVDSREWFIGPQLAVSRSHETLVWPDKSVHKNLFTMVWHKKGGQWYLVHTHMSEY